MAKKNFGNVIDNILGDEQQQPQGASETGTEAAPQKGKGRPKLMDYERRTFIVRKDLFFKLNQISAKEMLLQKDIIEVALENFIGAYETKHGEIDTSTMTEQKKSARDII